MYKTVQFDQQSGANLVRCGSLYLRLFLSPRINLCHWRACERGWHLPDGFDQIAKSVTHLNVIICLHSWDSLCRTTLYARFVPIYCCHFGLARILFRLWIMLPLCLSRPFPSFFNCCHTVFYDGLAFLIWSPVFLCMCAALCCLVIDHFRFYCG